MYIIYTFSTICSTFSIVVSQLLWQSAVRWCLHCNLLTSFIKFFVENQINNPVIFSFYLYLLSHNIQYELIRWYLNWPTYSVACESKLDIDVRWIKCIKNCMNKCLNVVCLKVLWVVTGNVLYCTSASPYKCMCQNVELQLLYSLHTLTKVMNVMTILA